MQDDTKKDHSNTNEYSQTLNLPKTDFPLRANAAISDERMLQRWDQEKLSEKTFDHNHGKEKFILHDGPPYSNGHIHLGHAYNKILKDIFTKFERMSGKHVPVIPGWDCHGLPIELKVTQEQKFASRTELQQACRKYAHHWIDVQREEFKKLGVMMHWSKPYATMDYAYEAAIVRGFGEFFKQGFIQKKLKTVPWCMSCQTVLANAEIEYEDRKDPSVYVQFPFDLSLSKKLFNIDRSVGLLVWTTTPWTLPLNRAVVVHPDAQYALVDVAGQLVILGKDLVDSFAKLSGLSVEVIQTFASEKIVGQKVQHPFIAHLHVPIIADDFVSLTDGTACVHSAPGCGPEDYEVALKHNLEIYSPLSVDGKYTKDIVPAELAGMAVTDGQIWVIKKLAELNRIIFKNSIRHSYPHCWRCHNGLIFRATSQWFCDLSQHKLKDRALAAIDQLRMIPETGRNRFSATLQGRLEWCLSRQRTWGVPIPALQCKSCSHTFTTLQLIELVACGIEKSGIEFWNQVSISDLGKYSCVSCKSSNLVKEYDILDVWFESGVSHYAVLYKNKAQQFPADMYLEGKDQHRAWFQSSLLTGLVLENSAPMKEILTHGFTVDAHGKKMSKSLGNVVTPDQIIKQVGTDGLRLWVASNDYNSDPVVSDLLLKNVSEVYRKVRNTCRFLLSNLYDFDLNNDAVATEKLYPIDQHAIVSLHEFNQAVQKAYSDRKTVAIFSMLADYCAKDLSSLYLDVIKDRLYTEKADSHARRCAQTVCARILHTLTTLIAPILSFTAEEIFDHYKNQDKKTASDSIHLQHFAQTQILHDKVLELYENNVKPYHTRSGFERFNVAIEYVRTWNTLRTIRESVLKMLEIARTQGMIGHSLDAQVQVCITQDFADFSHIKKFVKTLTTQSAVEFFKEFLIVSDVTLSEVHSAGQVELEKGLFVSVAHAQGAKCARCWQWSKACEQGDLCNRCRNVLKK
ncbi:isoleucine--tRNA ligase [Candidatus Babeliales bacterium]|nr:isoleucine--tRNA ligase [Candidatus Babeliales bacterium]